MQTEPTKKLTLREYLLLPFVLGLSLTVFDAISTQSKISLHFILYYFFLYSLVIAGGYLSLSLNYIFKIKNSNTCTGICILGTFITFVVYLGKAFTIFESLVKGITIGLLLALLVAVGLKFWESVNRKI